MKKWLCLAPVLFLLVACNSPTARIKDKIQEFKEQSKDHIISYQQSGWHLRLAWSGNPEKPPLIFVHGSPGSWEVWSEFLLNPELKNRYQMIAVDRLGYGGSEEGQSFGSLHDQAAAVMAALQFNKSHEKALIVGHSYGGAVVAQMAIDWPEKIRGVIFVASAVDPSLEKTKWYQYVAALWPIRDLIATHLRVCNEEIFALKSQLQLLEPRWNRLQAQVATIQGTKDDQVPLGNQDFILSHVPQKNVIFKIRQEGMNHYVPWEHPEMILQAIKSFQD